MSARTISIENALKAAQSGVFIFDPQAAGQQILFMNQAFADIMGMDMVDLEKLSFKDFKEKFFDARAQESLKKIFEKEKPATIELRAGQALEERWFSLQVSPLKGVESVHYMGIISDITRAHIKSAKQKLRNRIDGMAKLSGKVCHDLNNKVSLIDGYSLIAEKALESDSSALDPIGKIKAVAGQTVSIAQSLAAPWLDKKSAPVPLEILDIAKDLKFFFKAVLPSGIYIEVKEPEQAANGPAVDAFPEALSVLLLGVAAHAGTRALEGSLIHFTAKETPLSDTAEDVRDHIESDFCTDLQISFEGKSAAPASELFCLYDPVGLDFPLLALYELAADCGSYLHINAQETDCFTMSFIWPVSTLKKEKAIQGSLTDLKDISFKGYTVFVVDDEPDIRGLVSDMLEGVGMRVVQAANGNDALIKQDEFEDQIDLLVTDVVMPELDGIQLANLFETQRPESRIIFMSGYPKHNRIEDRSVPEDAYFLHKPINQDSLVKTIFQCLNERPSMEAAS